jgi:hypothetical protein
VLSTLASYRVLSANIGRSLTIAAKQPMVARETDYYRENIGEVKSVDDFLNDHRLFAYAMKAYGLDEMTYAKAFMKKVLESDLTDSHSLANTLSDQRYLDFAKAFHFLSSGDVDVGATVAQDAASQDALIGLYSQQRINKGAAAATEAEFYQGRIDSITNVDDLLSDERLFNFALTAYGIDADIASVSAIRDVLTSDLSDPNSVANLYGTNYQKLAAAFSFETDGSLAPGGTAQTSDQVSQTTLAYYETTGTEYSPAAAAFKTGYFSELMAGITNVDDLVDNAFLRSYVAAAAGLDPTGTTAATVREILVSDLSDPDSAANQSVALKTVAQAFNFNTDGSLDPGVAAQDADQATTLTNLFLTNYDDAAISTEQINIDFYKGTIGSVLHVDDLLSKSLLYKIMLSSYDIDPSEVSQSEIKKVLLSDPADPSSFASLLRDSRFTALAAAFNFDSDGNALGVKQAETESAVNGTVARYTATLGEYEVDQKLGKAESEYYTQTIGTITSVDQLLSDQRLKTYIVNAYGLEKDVSNATLREILTSDRADRSSFVNTSNNAAYEALAADFNFDSDGTVRRSNVGVAQDWNEIITTQELYYHQTVEENAGEDNEGVRLALYFSRKASSIDSAYDILADKALLRVAQTALGLPESMSLQDIDRQAKLITDHLDLADLQDPDKLNQFVNRFSAKWDIDNSTASTTNPAVTLFTQSANATVSTDLMSSIQNLRLGGV